MTFNMPKFFGGVTTIDRRIFSFNECGKRVTFALWFCENCVRWSLWFWNPFRKQRAIVVQWMHGRLYAEDAEKSRVRVQEHFQHCELAKGI